MPRFIGYDADFYLNFSASIFPAVQLYSASLHFAQGFRPMQEDKHKSAYMQALHAPLYRV